MRERGSFPFGPTPVEFHVTFRVGDRRGIHPVDACGVMLAAIQALQQDARKQDCEIQVLKKEIHALGKNR